MTGMNVVEFFQDEVQFPYGGIRRVSSTLADTLFSLLLSYLILALLPSNLHFYIMAM